MARASTYTRLSLDRFQQLLGMHPLHFNQIQMDEQDAINDDMSCGLTVSQYGWQAHGRLGREEIAIAIQRAEEMIAKAMGFDVAPTWNEADVVMFDQDVAGGSYGYYGMPAKLPKGYVLMGGRRTKTVVPGGPKTIVYSSDFGSSYKERATIAYVGDWPTALTDPQEIHVYYPGKDGDDAWEIRPINVSLDPANGNATITFKREQCVKDTILEDYMGDNDALGSDDDDFITAVDVYRVYNDPATQVRLIWEPPNTTFDLFGLTLCGCGGTGCTTCGYTTQTACMTVHNRRTGQIRVTPASWDDTLGDFVNESFAVARRPDRALVWYRAGFYNPNLKYPLLALDPRMETAVFYLALSLMARPICGCEGIKDLHEVYYTDFAEVSSDPGGSLNYTAGYVDNPFGTRRGAIEAWKIVKQFALGRKIPHG